MWHSATITPIAFAAAILGFARCYRWRIKPVTWMLLITLSVATLLTASRGPLAAAGRRGTFLLSARRASDALLVLARIPPDVSVSAQTVLMPALSERKQVYIFPNPFYRSCWGPTAEALAQQEGQGFAEWPVQQYEHAMASAPVEFVLLGRQSNIVIPQTIYEGLQAALLDCPRYGIVDICGEYALLRRGMDHAAGLRMLEASSGTAIHTRADLLRAYWLVKDRAASIATPHAGGLVE
jgi:hypothetical protein